MLRYSILVCMVLALTAWKAASTNSTEKEVSSKQNNQLLTDSAALINTVAVLDSSLLEIHFCGDELPLHDAAVARRYQKAVEAFDNPAFKANRHKVASELKTINQILKKHKVPSDFRYVPLIESNFVATAVSPKGAGGYWQLMPETARALGLRVDATVDERRDLIKSTNAAAKYLQWLYGQLGDWTLVAAAYNVGPGKLIKHMDSQKKNDFYQLRLNNETSKYVYKIVAAKEWFNAPTRCREWTSEGFLAKVSEFHSKPNDIYNEVVSKENNLVKATTL